MLNTQSSKLNAVSKPFLPFKEPEHPQRGGNHDRPHDKIAMMPMQFGDIFEIGAIDPDDKGDGDENYRNNG